MIGITATRDIETYALFVDDITRSHINRMKRSHHVVSSNSIILAFMLLVVVSTSAGVAGLMCVDHLLFCIQSGFNLLIDRICNYMRWHNIMAWCFWPNDHIANTKINSSTKLSDRLRHAPNIKYAFAFQLLSTSVVVRNCIVFCFIVHFYKAANILDCNFVFIKKFFN